jgi:hypothetical protein
VGKRMLHKSSVEGIQSFYMCPFCMYGDGKLIKSH